MATVRVDVTFTEQRLRVQLNLQQVQGSVQVDRVEPQSAAHGRVAPGATLVAVNGTPIRPLMGRQAWVDFCERVRETPRPMTLTFEQAAPAGTVAVPPPPGAAGIALGQLSKETRMIGTNSAFASAGGVLAGQELVKDGDVGGGEGDGDGLRTAEEARARADVEEELRRRRGELTDAEAGGSGAADAGAGGDDNRGAESWLTAIEEVAVAPELKIRNIEETERMKRAIEVKETKKRPPPSEIALARRQFVTGFGNKRERQEATESSKRDKERRKNFFKKKRHKK